jgi:hypothetical protein
MVPDSQRDRVMAAMAARPRILTRVRLVRCIHVSEYLLHASLAVGAYWMLSTSNVADAPPARLTIAVASLAALWALGFVAIKYVALRLSAHAVASSLLEMLASRSDATADSGAGPRRLSAHRRRSLAATIAARTWREELGSNWLFVMLRTLANSNSRPNEASRSDWLMIEACCRTAHTSGMMPPRVQDRDAMLDLAERASRIEGSLDEDTNMAVGAAYLFAFAWVVVTSLLLAWGASRLPDGGFGGAPTAFLAIGCVVIPPVALVMRAETRQQALRQVFIVDALVTGAIDENADDSRLRASA